MLWNRRDLLIDTDLRLSYFYENEFMKRKKQSLSQFNQHVNKPTIINIKVK